MNPQGKAYRPSSDAVEATVVLQSATKGMESRAVCHGHDLCDGHWRRPGVGDGQFILIALDVVKRDYGPTDKRTEEKIGKQSDDQTYR